MGFIFRPALRENVQLIIGLAGGTGSGKTYTAMRIAKGICGDKRFCVIDTENGRSKHYADRFDFDHGDLRAPFSPARYEEAIVAADAAGYPCIVVDSMSHEHAGDGGILDMQEEEWARSGHAENKKMLSWAKPKKQHKDMVSKLLQLKAHLILCFRAEEKIEMAKEDGKTVVRPKRSLVGYGGWVPIAEKTLPFEATASFLFMADRPGIPIPIKLQEQHRSIFDLAKPVTEECGHRIAEWSRGEKPTAATGGTTQTPAGQPPAPETSETTGPAPLPWESKTDEQLIDYIRRRRDEIGHEQVARYVLDTWKTSMNGIKKDREKLLALIAWMDEIGA